MRFWRIWKKQKKSLELNNYYCPCDRVSYPCHRVGICIMKLKSKSKGLEHEAKTQGFF